MPLQNRVTPAGEIIATPYRGLLMGNRGGAFHRDDRTLGSARWASRQWICCVLEFKCRRRAVMQPHRYTELFFLDEATALAAGHRPCFECRRADALRFAELWAEAQGLSERPKAPDMDVLLHRQRLAGGGTKATHTANIGGLPDGTFLRFESPENAVPDQEYLVHGKTLLPWSAAGYGAPRHRPQHGHATVLTPSAIVAVLSAGYRPILHPTSRGSAG